MDTKEGHNLALEERYPLDIVKPERIRDLLGDNDYVARQALDNLNTEIDVMKEAGVNVEKLETLISLFYTPSKIALYRSLQRGEKCWNIFEIHVADMISEDAKFPNTK